MRSWRGAEESAAGRELHFLRRLESAVSRPALLRPRRWISISAAYAKEHRPFGRQGLALLSVAVNLSMLGFFKYGNFLLENFQWVLARGGIAYQPPHLDVFLPIGISFYTFHSLSYTLDIYRGILKPTRSLRDFVLAVSFFPQLVAGPIVRAGDFLPQLEAAAEAADWPFPLGPAADDARSVRKNRARRYAARRNRPIRVFGLWRAADGARRLDRGDGVRGADLFRFRRLLDLRHRRRALSRISSQGQFPVSLRRDRVLGFLAALAHFAFHLSARLSLHSARRQPRRRAPRDDQPRDRDVHRRPLARRRVDFCRLGSVPRLATW